MLAVEVVDFILQLVFGSPNPLKLIMRIVINNKVSPLNCQGCWEFSDPYKITIKKGQNCKYKRGQILIEPQKPVSGNTERKHT